MQVLAHSLVALLMLLCSVLGGWGAVVAVLRLARVPQVPPHHVASPDGRQAPVLEAAERHPVQQPVLRGGTWIGLLERLATTGALLSGQPGLIGLVVAVKGLGRWADLQDNPGAAERFIIGTLASLTWACGWGLAGRALLGT